jgi:hypothetical protein
VPWSQRACTARCIRRDRCGEFRWRLSLQGSNERRKQNSTSHLFGIACSPGDQSPGYATTPNEFGCISSPIHRALSCSPATSSPGGRRKKTSEFSIFQPALPDHQLDRSTGRPASQYSLRFVIGRCAKPPRSCRGSTSGRAAFTCNESSSTLAHRLSNQPTTTLLARFRGVRCFAAS